MTIAAKEQFFHASHDLKREWTTFCAKAMGYEDGVIYDEVEEHQDVVAADAVGKNGTLRMSDVVILNLLPEGHGSMTKKHDRSSGADNADADESSSLSGRGKKRRKRQSDDKHMELWMENAMRISLGLDKVMDLVRRKSASYISHVVSDDEAALLESTVLSFTAKTANQIESLRQQPHPVSTSADFQNFAQGVVACLFQRLQEEIAKPFGVMQKKRQNVTLQLYQNPLQCSLIPRRRRGRHDYDDATTSKSFQSLLDDGEEEEENQAFDPMGVPPPAIAGDIFADYATTASLSHDVLQRPQSSLLKLTPASTEEEETVATKKLPQAGKRRQQQQEQELLPYQQPVSSSPQDDILLQQEEEETLQQEAALLSAKVNNDLDAVQNVELQMTQITTLLSQFSALVAEQQEEVTLIHETTIRSKDNMTKGQDSLVDAAQRTKESKHYMATIVTVMAFVLLLFNSITP